MHTHNAWGVLCPPGEGIGRPPRVRGVATPNSGAAKAAPSPRGG